MAVDESPSSVSTGAVGWVLTEMHILLRALRKGLRDQGRDLAAAIAFWTFFSIFPLVLGVGSAAAYLFDSDVAQQRLLEVLNAALPTGADLVHHNLDSVMAARGAFGLIGIIGLFWSGSAAFGAISRALDRAIGARRRRPILSKLSYVAMAVAASALLLLSVVATILLEIVMSSDTRLLGRFGIETGSVNKLVGILAGVVSAWLTFALIFRFTPSIRTRWRQVLPGAIAGALLFELGKRGFLLYLGRASHFAVVYGSLSSIVVLLLWLYLSALVLIFAAEYNFVRWRVRHPGDVGANESPK